MSKKRRLFSFYIYHEVFKRLKDLAKKEDVSMSSVVNQAVEEFLNSENND